MKKILTLMAALGIYTSSGYAQNTIAIGNKDSKATVLAKAAKVVPTTNQLAALQNEFIAFIHIGPNTFTRREWGTGKEDPKVFDLKTLHTDQWCQTLKAAGMKMVILTVKHHDGFVLWQSRYTKHGIMSTDFMHGKGDILKELSSSCKKAGLKLGIYLSPADLFQIEDPAGLYGNLSKMTMRSIPRDIAGRPFANRTKFQFKVDDYNEYFLNQLFEVLTEYGPVDEVWFDGATPKSKGGQKYNYQAWKEMIHVLAPKAVIFGKEDVRWCGNESGATRTSEWNVVPYEYNPDTAAYFPDLTSKSLGERPQLYGAKYLHYQQAETNTSIREGWFYRDDDKQKVRSADDVYDIYERSVGGNSTFLLNIPPNREGKFSEEDVDVLNEVGRRINETYGENLFKGAVGPKQVLDKDAKSFILLKGKLKTIYISTAKPVTINRLLIQEAIGTHSEIVESHNLEAWINGRWQLIVTSTNIGYKRILRFPEITATKFRFKVLADRGSAAISTITAHYYRSRPPQLQLIRDLNGMLTIAPKAEVFGWKPHGESATANLSKGVEIYYTTNGTQPSLTSTKYTEPFKVGVAEIKAISVLHKEKGALASARFGLIKKDWKLINADSEVKGHEAALAFDAQPQTYWLSEPTTGNHQITVDLGSSHHLTGFIYTPPVQFSDGMMEKGKLQTSSDGQNWQDADTFEFGNLINDPTPRRYDFKQALDARYIRIEATLIAGDKNSLAIAEIDFL